MNEKEMDKELFAKGLKDLHLFFPKMQINREQAEAWYSRLKFFEDDALRLAVSNIVDTYGSAPGFQELSKELWKARRRLVLTRRKQSQGIEASGACAPTGANMTKTATYMQMLKQALTKPPSEREAELQTMKALWTREYKTFEGYHTQSQVQRLIDQRRFDDLKKLGVIRDGGVHEPVVVPMLESEKNDNKKLGA